MAMGRRKREADERYHERWARVWQSLQNKAEELPIPASWRRELYDTLRVFGGQCSVGCGHEDHHGRRR